MNRQIATRGIVDGVSDAASRIEKLLDVDERCVSYEHMKRIHCEDYIISPPPTTDSNRNKKLICIEDIHSPVPIAVNFNVAFDNSINGSFVIPSPWSGLVIDVPYNVDESTYIDETVIGNALSNIDFNRLDLYDARTIRYTNKPSTQTLVPLTSSDVADIRSWRMNHIEDAENATFYSSYPHKSFKLFIFPTELLQDYSASYEYYRVSMEFFLKNCWTGLCEKNYSGSATPYVYAYDIKSNTPERITDWEVSSSDYMRAPTNPIDHYITFHDNLLFSLNTEFGKYINSDPVLFKPVGTYNRIPEDYFASGCIFPTISNYSKGTEGKLKITKDKIYMMTSSFSHITYPYDKLIATVVNGVTEFYELFEAGGGGQSYWYAFENYPDSSLTDYTNGLNHLFGSKPATGVGSFWFGFLFTEFNKIKGDKYNSIKAKIEFDFTNVDIEDGLEILILALNLSTDKEGSGRNIITGEWVPDEYEQPSNYEPFTNKIYKGIVEYGLGTNLNDWDTHSTTAGNIYIIVKKDDGFVMDFDYGLDYFENFESAALNYIWGANADTVDSLIKNIASGTGIRYTYFANARFVFKGSINSSDDPWSTLVLDRIEDIV